MALPALLLAVFGLCLPAAPDDGPVVRALTLTPNPNPRAPLALLVALECDEPVRVHVELDDGELPLRVQPQDALATAHELVVLGARPGREYEVVVVVQSADGRTTRASPGAWSTPPLPDGFPPLHVTVTRGARMEPGVTLIPAVRWDASGAPQRDFGVLVALDARGDVVWFFDAPYPVSEAKRLRNGNLLAYYGTAGDVVELDMLGNEQRRWCATRLPGKVCPEGAIPVDAGTLHHEVIELPSGNFMALSTELRRFADYWTDESDPGAPRAPSWLVGDVVIEYTPDGEVVDRVPLLDVLDPYRIGYESLDPGFWRGVYTGAEGEPIRDWSHANSLDYDADDNAVIVSLYHQDCVFEYDLDTRAISWMLAFDSGWGAAWREELLYPEGEGLYPFHQHAARLTPEGTLLMFDNGKYRALPPTPPMDPAESFSRAVEFAIDEERGTFRQVWSHGGRPGEIFFTAFLGDTDFLPRTGNVLVTDGGRIRRPDGSFGIHPNEGQKWARVFEVTRTEPSRVVFEVVLDDPAWGWTVYRSERLPSLYPAVGGGR